MIPNADRAEVSLRNLRDYCLNPLHNEGRLRARIFASTLGLTAADAVALQERLLEAVRTRDAQVGYRDAYGQRYAVDVPVEWRGKHAILRSGWLLKHGSEVPRLTSCYVL